MIEQILAQVRALMTSKPAKSSPITTLLMDDTFCTLLMAHRSEQGMVLPEQSALVDASDRLAYLHALRDGTAVAEARENCDRTNILRKKRAEAKAHHSIDIRAALNKMFTAELSPENQPSFFAGQYILYGEERIAQSTIPLHQPETGLDDVILIVSDMLRRFPDPCITMSDRNPDTTQTSFIRVGTEAAHFTFPETGDPKTGSRAAILHYEIDHPGGDMVFFTTPGNFGPLSEMMLDIEDRNPLFINEMPQLMAVNSLYLQEMGAFCVPCGDTCITMLLRDGVLTAAERPDLSGEVEEILNALEQRGVSAAERASLSDFLRNVEVEDDYDWQTIERLSAQHPDLLGSQEMDIEMSNVFGIPKAELLKHAFRLCAGDEKTAEAEVEGFIEGAACIELPSGRHHLYVANLASQSLYDALPAFNKASGREDQDLIFVLADHPLDLGDDHDMVSTMRELAPMPEEEMPTL